MEQISWAYLVDHICTVIMDVYFGHFFINYQVVGHVECVQTGKISNWLQLVNLVEMSKKIGTFQFLICLISKVSLLIYASMRKCTHTRGWWINIHLVVRDP